MATVSGSTCVIAATRAMQHLERHLPEIERIFTKFRIPTSDYHLFAGFDESLLGSFYLDQIHIYIDYKPRNMTCLLRRLGLVLLPFITLVFTDKSFHRLPPSTPPDHLDMSCGLTDNMKTTHTILATTFLSKNVDMGGGWNRQITSDGGTEGGPDKSWNSTIAFNTVLNLHHSSQLKGIKALPLQGELMLERTSESDKLQDFATCCFKFTKLRTTTYPANLAYSHFHLHVAIDSRDEITSIDGVRPGPTPKYSEGFPPPPKRESSSVIAKFIRRLRFGAGADCTGRQATSTQATVSRIIDWTMGPKAEWAFHITDPLGSGIALSPDQLPRARFDFVGKTDIPAPPPTHMNIEILSFWNMRNSGTCGKPAYSNICQVVNLEVPSNLRGSHVCDATLELWPKQPLSADQGELPQSKVEMHR